MPKKTEQKIKPNISARNSAEVNSFKNLMFLFDNVVPFRHFIP